MQTIGDYALREATNADVPAVWALISSVLRSYGITTNEQTTDKDLVDIEAYYWDRKGAFFLLLRGEEVIGTAALHHETDAVCEICRMYLAAAIPRAGAGAPVAGALHQRGQGARVRGDVPKDCVSAGGSNFPV